MDKYIGFDIDCKKVALKLGGFAISFSAVRYKYYSSITF